MEKHVCTLCGYVYDPTEGDRDGEIEPGISFEDLHDGWTCPLCGAEKDQFQEGETVQERG